MNRYLLAFVLAVLPVVASANPRRHRHPSFPSKVTQSETSSQTASLSTCALSPST